MAWVVFVRMTVYPGGITDQCKFMEYPKTQMVPYQLNIFQPKCPIFIKKQQKAVVFMFLTENIRISKFKMAAAHPLILRKLGKILIKMATVGSKIMLKIQVNAQNDTTDKPFPLVYDKIIYIAINVFKIRKRCIL